MSFHALKSKWTYCVTYSGSSNTLLQQYQDPETLHIARNIATLAGRRAAQACISSDVQRLACPQSAILPVGMTWSKFRISSNVKNNILQICCEIIAFFYRKANILCRWSNILWKLYQNKGLCHCCRSHCLGWEHALLYVAYEQLQN